MDIARRLQQLRTAQGLSLNELARRSGVAQSSLSYIEGGDRQPSVEVIERICRGLGVTLAEFFAEEQKPELSPDLRQILDAARQLTPRQRKLLLEVMEEWIAQNKK